MKENQYSRLEITSQNVIATCPECQSDFYIDIYAALKEGGVYADEAALLCENCSRRMDDMFSRMVKAAYKDAAHKILEKRN